jgi:putative flippase GtrA
MKLVHRALCAKFLRYSIGWGLAALLDLSLLRFLTDTLHIYYLLSATIAFIISVTFAYVFQKYITFKDYSKKHLIQGWLFVFFQLIGLWIYMFLLWVGVEHMWIYYMFVAIFAKWIAFVRNYISNYYFNFKQ